MKNCPYDMLDAVSKWEAVNSNEIKELFELYLFPIRQWSNNKKSDSFTVKEIDYYKGIGENSPYTYAKRVGKAMPYFQITESFTAGNDFFQMIDHYLKLLNIVITIINENEKFKGIKNILDNEDNKSIGFLYAKNLFFCAFVCYYDKFKNDEVQVIIKLFLWAFMLRVDMENLGFSSINKYAIGGEEEEKYTNKIPIFFLIRNSRLHSEIANIIIEVSWNPNHKRDTWKRLYKRLKGLKKG